VLALFFGGLATFALVRQFSDTVRGTPVEEVVGVGAPLRTSAPDFAERAGFLSETALSTGHEVEVLLDDEVFARMIPDLAAARASITLLGYYCGPGKLGDRVSEVLAERARAGVKVMFLGDDFGCGELLDQIRAPLTQAGAAVAYFRPVRWYSVGRAQHRMHARSVVIDGRIGYTGGFGIDDKWTEDAPDEPMWRDTAVRFRGPAVLQMQSTFLAAWAEATGVLVTDEALMPRPEGDPAGDVTAGLLYSSPGIGPTAAERYVALTVSAAERTLYISNSYFIPTPPMRRLLLEAASRGVDVRLLLPDSLIDIPTARYAARGFYEELIRGGIRIFEYQPSMIHAKTVVADGFWASVGSLNLDNRSVRLNDESALLVADARVGARMDSIFQHDLTKAREITLEAHRKRPRIERLFEVLTRIIAPML
jgi:cardiolipin synthase A/B